jgi:hypothetical protein
MGKRMEAVSGSWLGRDRAGIGLVLGKALPSVQVLSSGDAKQVLNAAGGNISGGGDPSRQGCRAPLQVGGCGCGHGLTRRTRAGERGSRMGAGEIERIKAFSSLRGGIRL